MLQRDTRKNPATRTILINMIFFAKKIVSDYKFPKQFPSVFRTEDFSIKKISNRIGSKKVPHQVPAFLTKKWAFAKYLFYFIFYENVLKKYTENDQLNYQAPSLYN
jgi:hypothetical protein